MPTGWTTTDALDASLPSLVNEARTVQEQVGVMTQLAHRVRLGEGMGNTWKEVQYEKLTASAITETTEEDNPQQLVDTPFSLTPQVISVHTIVTDRTARNISKNAWAQTGKLGQNAIERKKDQDGLVILDGATTSLGGAGTTLTSGHISAGATRVENNTTEPWSGPKAFVLHGYQMKDIFDELVAGVGTYPLPSGPTANVFKGGFNLPIMDAAGFKDGNITIDGSDDAKGGVFASGANGAIVLVQARAPWIKTVRNEKLGGGSTESLHRDEYAWGQRGPADWLLELYSDALAPTS
tara:strand:+ start:4368 stop:5252 length:885 start_codon:yes stop_codon:yes gene_type:complete